MSSQPVIATLELRKRGPHLSRGGAVGLAAFAAFCGAGMATNLKGLLQGAVPVGALLGLGAIAGAALVLAFWRRLTRVVEPSPVVITTGDVTLPIAGGPVPLTEITSIEERELPETGFNAKVGSKSRALLVGTATRGHVVLRASAFVDEKNGAALLQQHLRQAMGALPDGAARLAAMAERESEARAFVAAKTRATWALIGVIAAVFAIEMSHGLDDKAFLLRLGGNAPALVERGEWWRLFTANFIHLGWLHIYLNGFALLSLGILLEKALGVWRFLAVALVAGLCGNVASTLFGAHAFSAGASSILFGLLAALFVVNVMHRGRLPAGLAITKKRWVTLIAVNVFISLLPGVDALAHAGGALGGVVALFVVGVSVGPAHKPRRIAAALALVLVAAYLVAAAAGLRYAQTTTTSPQDDYLSALMGSERAVALNEAAWQIAIDNAATPERLMRAEELARRAVELSATSSTFASEGRAGALDTHAYVLHRLGRVDEGLALERRAAWMAPTHPGLHTMLARMLLARAQRAGAPPDVTLAREGSDVVVTGAPGAPGAGGVVIYAIVERSEGGAPVGLVRVVLPDAVATGGVRVQVPGLPSEPFPLRVLFADPSADRPEQSPSPLGAYVAMEAATLALPWP